METTKLSSKGQVIIPKALRSAHHWDTGMELLVIDVGDGLLLKPKPPFAQTRLDEVAGCLRYPGRAKSAGEIDAAVRQRIREEWSGRG
jgi:AbrB family looped-hinge helix DNA binding protein